MQDKIPTVIADQIELPVIVAPMFIVSSPNMVLESCKKGVIGTFPLFNARTSEALDKWMLTITEGLKQEKRSNPNRKIAPWGVNLNVHRSNTRYESDMELIKKYEPPLVITSLGNPANVAKIVHGYGGYVFSDVISIRHAKKAAQAGVDGLILVSSGAGGHGGMNHPFAFLSEVKHFWNGMTILAGSISKGHEVLAAKILGADFVYMGTRFIAAEEALAKDEYKQMLIDTNIEDIIYTDAFSGVHGNYLIPSIQNAGLDPANLKARDEIDIAHNKERPKAWKDIWSAGQGVGAVKKIQPIAEIIDELSEEYREATTTKDS